MRRGVLAGWWDRSRDVEEEEVGCEGNVAEEGFRVVARPFDDRGERGMGRRRFDGR